MNLDVEELDYDFLKNEMDSMLIDEGNQDGQVQE